MENNIKKFLAIARQSTYASGKKAKIVAGMKVYVIKDGDLEYRDSYYDQHLVFQGQEVVSEKGKPIWSMSYRGSAVWGTDAGKVFSFLQEILKEHSDVVRLPGNKIFKKDDWRYEDHCDGKLDEFNGFEEIYLNDKLVHWMKYFGGEIK